MSNVLTPYTQHAISQQVQTLTQSFHQLSTTYYQYVKNITDRYNALKADGFKSTAASQIQDQFNALTTYAPPRIDVAPKHSNLQRLLDQLHTLTHTLEGTADYYDHINGWDGGFLFIGNRPGNLDDAATSHQTNKDYARFILGVLNNDFSHPRSISPMLERGYGGVLGSGYIEGWTPEDSHKQDLSYREDIRHVIEEWANDVKSNYDQFISEQLTPLIEELLHPGSSMGGDVPRIDSTKFEKQMSYAELYDQIAAGENNDDSKDKVGFTKVTMSTGETAILVTLPGTQPTKLAQANGPIDGFIGLFNGPNPYTTKVEQEIQDYLHKNHLPDNTPLVLGGHSLGGMVAQQVIEDTNAGSVHFNIREVITYGSPYVYGELPTSGPTDLLPPIPIADKHMFYNVGDVVVNIAGAKTFLSSHAYETPTINLRIDPNPVDTHDYSGSIPLQDTHVDFTVAGDTTYYDLGGVPQEIATAIGNPS